MPPAGVASSCQGSSFLRRRAGGFQVLQSPFFFPTTKLGLANLCFPLVSLSNHIFKAITPPLGAEFLPSQIQLKEGPNIQQRRLTDEPQGPQWWSIQYK